MAQRTFTFKMKVYVVVACLAVLLAAALTRARQPEMVGYAAKLMVVLVVFSSLLSLVIEKPWDPWRQCKIAAVSLASMEGLWFTGVLLAGPWV